MIYLGLLLLSSLLILLHEVGHLLAARAVRIPVGGFSVGLGPTFESLLISPFLRDVVRYRG